MKANIMLRRLWTLLLAVTLALGALAALQPPASAESTTTPLLGDTGVPRIPRDGIPGSSSCPAGAYVVGARVWVDTYPRVTGFAALCTSSAGSTPTLGVVVGDTDTTGTRSAVAVGDSVCDGTDLAVGLRAANGEVINALGVRCQGTSGPYDAATIGNQTTIRNNADCAGGTALTGIHGWHNIYGGPHTNVYGVQGDCAPTDTAPPATTVTADRAPDSNGWYNHPFTTRWSTSEPNATCTTRAYGGPDTSTGSLSGSCTDAARNVGDPVAFSFRYDANAPTVKKKKFKRYAALSKGFQIAVRDNLSGVGAVEVTLRPASGGTKVRDATCITGCGTTRSRWLVSTAGISGRFKVKARATDLAGNSSARDIGWRGVRD